MALQISHPLAKAFQELTNFEYSKSQAHIFMPSAHQSTPFWYLPQDGKMKENKF